MDIPPAFRKLAQRFHQDIFRLAGNQQELLANALRGLSVEERRSVKTYLTELLASDPSDEALDDIWNQLDSDWFFRAPRKLFTAIRDAA